VTHVFLLSIIVVIIALTATLMISGTADARKTQNFPPKYAVPADAHV